MSAKKTFYLGTAIKFTTVVNLANPTSVTIKIEDPSDRVKVNDAAMTQLNDSSYQYIYQSSETDDEGEYKVTIKATYSGYTSKQVDYFELIED